MSAPLSSLAQAIVDRPKPVGWRSQADDERAVVARYQAAASGVKAAKPAKKKPAVKRAAAVKKTAAKAKAAPKRKVAAKATPKKAAPKKAKKVAK